MPPMKSKKKKLLLVLLVLVGVAILQGGCSDSKPETAAAAPPASPPPISAASPSTSPALIKIEDFLAVSGPLIVEHQVDVTAQHDGIVVSLSADTSKRVTTGEVLARLDERQLFANLEAARAKSRSVAADLKNWESEAEVLKADYVRQQHLWDLGLTSEEQLQHAKYKAESDQWDIKRVQETLNTAHDEERSLELELEKTHIIAPFDGIVARRYVRVGQGVSKGDRLFWITAEAPLRMRFTLPEKFIGHLRQGQSLPLTSPDVPQEQHFAKIIAVSPVVDPSSGTIEILVELTGPHRALRPGMTASVRLQNPR
jgi:membrane fusion protein (multidrug efflux system)